MTVSNLLYLMQFQPFDDIKTWRAQVFNELTAWYIIIILQGFLGTMFGPEE
jgi:hypothetical protein